MWFQGLRLERVTRIELASSAWKAEVLAVELHPQIVCSANAGRAADPDESRSSGTVESRQRCIGPNPATSGRQRYTETAQLHPAHERGVLDGVRRADLAVTVRPAACESGANQVREGDRATQSHVVGANSRFVTRIEDVVSIQVPDHAVTAAVGKWSIAVCVVRQRE